MKKTGSMFFFLVIKVDFLKNERFFTALLVPERCTQNSSNKASFSLHSEIYLAYSSVSGKISLTEMEVFPEQRL